jgi:PP-loop superfamily ATP-utilizing enzyme
MTNQIMDHAIELLRFGMRQPKESEVRAMVLKEGIRQLEIIVPPERLALAVKHLQEVLQTFDADGEEAAVRKLDNVLSQLRAKPSDLKSGKT